MTNKDYSKELLKLFESEDGKLFVAKDKPKGSTADDRLADSFLEIIDFVTENERKPEINSKDFSEESLAVRLEAIKNTPDKVMALEKYDSLGLLEQPNAPKSIEELIKNDEFGIFSGEGNDIMNVKNVPVAPIAAPKSVARRKRAKDFDKFKDGFETVQDGLKNGEYKLMRFTKSNQIMEGKYYISMGLMVFVEKINKKEIVHGRLKSRTRLVFENGTESEMYDRSLANDLYIDGYCVVHKDEIFDDTSDEAEQIKGYIYVARSLSEDPKISTIENLYKIGFSKTSVFKRTANAKDDPTYLMADVELVESYRLTGDYNPQKVEHMIHRVFTDAALDLRIIDKNEREYKPMEWYSVPIHIIREVVDLIDSGEIVHYVYDSDKQEMMQVQ
jgi:hypothetical protein